MKFVKQIFLLSLNFLFFYCWADQNPLYLFAHGLAATGNQVHLLYTKNHEVNGETHCHHHWLIDNEKYEVLSFNFPDALNDKGGLNFHRHLVNLGQELDLAAFHETYTNISSERDVVLLGLSRGAVTIINYAAHHDLPNVKAIILESPFETLLSIIKGILKRSYLPFNQYTGGIVLYLFTRYFPATDVNGICARTSIEFFPLDIPVLLIHSKKDKVVPIESSRKLYKALVERGHADVYLLELEHGSHGKLMKGASAQTYQDVVHAFYKKYNLPYNAQFAERGTPILENECRHH
jgi:pimeloyl-ACP methyl ester carboxylesterase